MDGRGSVGLIVALPEEARPLARAMQDARHHYLHGSHASPACHLVTGRLGLRRVILAWSGSGAAAASWAVDAALERGAETLLAVGFAGALAPALLPGDLLIADEVVEPGGASWRVEQPFLACGELTGTAIHVGRLVTVRHVVPSAGEKRRLGKETGAIAVDMESAAIARRAAHAGVPMAALRAVTDGVDDTLPHDLDTCFDSDGQFHRARLIPLLARHPCAARDLLRLGRHSARAGRALAAFLAGYFSCACDEDAPSGGGSL